MDISNMKNMVVLKNLPSNIIDEAIVILKGNQRIKKLEYVESRVNNSKGASKGKEQSDDYIVNEAEMLISNYISNLESKKDNNKDLKQKYAKLRTLTILLGIITIIQMILNFIK